MKSLISTLIFLSLFCTKSALAEILVIINKENTIETLSKSELIDLYMGRKNRFSNNLKATVIDITPSTIRKTFYKLVTGKSIAQINSYWASQQFTNRSRPPFKVKSNEDVIYYVKKYKSAIGYIESKYLTEEVKVILTVETDLK